MSVYTGAESTLVDAWIRQRLGVTAAASLDAISAGLSTRVFLDFAPEGTPYPFIIFQALTPPSDVRGVGIIRVMVDTLYLVKAVAQGTDYDALRPVVSVIDGALTQQDPVDMAGGILLTSVRDREFRLVEIENGKQFRHLGGEFRIQAQAA